MVKLVSAVTLALVLALTGEARAAMLSAAAMYADALAKEAAVRRAIETATAARNDGAGDPDGAPTYEALVRRYPTSGYCDDALWNAAQLAIDAAMRLADASHDGTATRLLRQLASQYPSSKHTKHVPELLASLDARPSAAPRRAAASDGSAIPAPALPVRPSATPTATATSPLVAAPVGTAGDEAGGATALVSAVASSVPGATPVVPSAADARAATPAMRRDSSAPVPRPTPVPSASRNTSESVSLVTLTGVNRTVLPDVVRLTLELDARCRSGTRN